MSHGDLFISGLTPAARHASWTGARSAREGRTGKTRQYLALLAKHDGVSDQHAAELLSLPLSSINSIRNGARELVEPIGFETAYVGSRTTRRTRWRIRTT